MRALILAGVCLLSLALAGCGGGDVKLVRVAGQVLMDGEPVPNARVIFDPAGGGRLSAGVTSDDGRYDLTYIEHRRGALPGNHKVRITTFVEADKDSSDPEIQTGRPETIPPEYNAQTTLEVEVPEQRTVELNFELESKPAAGGLSLAK